MHFVTGSRGPPGASGPIGDAGPPGDSGKSANQLHNYSSQTLKW